MELAIPLFPIHEFPSTSPSRLVVERGCVDASHKRLHSLSLSLSLFVFHEVSLSARRLFDLPIDDDALERSRIPQSEQVKFVYDSRSRSGSEKRGAALAGAERMRMQARACARGQPRVRPMPRVTRCSLPSRACTHVRTHARHGCSHLLRRATFSRHDGCVRTIITGGALTRRQFDSDTRLLSSPSRPAPPLLPGGRLLS